MKVADVTPDCPVLEMIGDICPPFVVQVTLRFFRGCPTKEAVRVKVAVWLEKMNEFWVETRLNARTNGPVIDFSWAVWSEVNPCEAAVRVLVPTPLVWRYVYT